MHNRFEEHDTPLFTDWIEGKPFSKPMPPFHYVLELLSQWDHLSKGESETTRQIREALKKDFLELGISV